MEGKHGVSSSLFKDKTAKENNIRLYEGTYFFVVGPNFETKAEVKAFRLLGADAVGMSTVPEAIVARLAGMQCIAFSVITDLGIIGVVEKVSHEEVLNAAKIAESKIRQVVKELVKEI